MDTKVCTGCQRDLPLSAFHKNGDRRQSRCKSCRASTDTYAPTGPSFFRDMVLAALGERPDARARINKHIEETRDVKGTSGGGGAGLIPPGYLADQYVLPARSPRPLADAAQSFPLPEYGDDFALATA